MKAQLHFPFLTALFVCSAFHLINIIIGVHVRFRVLSNFKSYRYPGALSGALGTSTYCYRCSRALGTSDYVGVGVRFRVLSELQIM